MEGRLISDGNRKMIVAKAKSPSKLSLGEREALAKLHSFGSASRCVFIIEMSELDFLSLISLDI